MIGSGFDVLAEYGIGHIQVLPDVVARNLEVNVVLAGIEAQGEDPADKSKDGFFGVAGINEL